MKKILTVFLSLCILLSVSAVFAEEMLETKELLPEWTRDQYFELCDPAPWTLDELQKAVDITDPRSVAAYYVWAVNRLPDDYDNAIDMMKYLYGGEGDNGGWDTALNEKLSDPAAKWPTRSYFIGAAAENGFYPTRPYILEMYYMRNDTEKLNAKTLRQTGRLNIVYWLMGYAAGNKVYITVSKDKGQDRWYITSETTAAQLFTDQNAVANENVRALMDGKPNDLTTQAEHDEKNAPLPFTDVDSAAYFGDAVKWAYDNKITEGVSDTEFAPLESCTRGQVVTFLWRAAGCPEPRIFADNRFNDVSALDYFYKPVLWAIEKGITAGTSENEFSPSMTCTTAHIITFLYRAMCIGDDGWYEEAKAWAQANGISDGTGINAEPSEMCPRGAVVTFLSRIYNY